MVCIDRDVIFTLGSCILGGIMSVTVVYAWHGIVYNARNASNQTFSDDKGMPGDGNLHHWMSFVFKVFHESAAEGIDNIN